MRIIALTPGTGNFYCGTCLRDNALALALRKRGHDVLMVPLSLPHLTEEPAAAEGMPIFFGGINVFLQQKSSFFRKTPRWLDRFFDSPTLLRQSAKKMGMTSARELGEMAVSMLRGEEGYQAKELGKLLGWLKTQARPDIIAISNSMLLGLARRIKNELGVRIVCTLQGEDTFLDSLGDPYRQQAWQLLAECAADVDHFIAVSHYIGELMQKRARLPAGHVTVIHNGINLDGFAPAQEPPAWPTLGFLAHMCQANSLGTLVDAFILLKQRGRVNDLKLRVAGSMTAKDERYVLGLRQKLAENGFGPDTEFLPNLDRREKQEFLRSLSVFSVPATYGEAFGLYVIEALASGVPVVEPRHAAFPELIEATGGGLLCEPDNPAALANAIEPLLLDPAKARILGAEGHRAVHEKFSVERMAKDIESVYEQVMKGERHAVRV